MGRGGRMNRKNWWKVMLAILVVSASGVLFIGVKTYQDAPPIPNFTDEKGAVVTDGESVLRGQQLFQRYALMEYGSMFGDGAGRGPDFTADALHEVAVFMNEYYASRGGGDPGAARAAAEARTKAELKSNRYTAGDNRVVLSAGEAAAFERLVVHYTDLFAGRGVEGMKPARYVTDAGEVRDLTSFFFWGAWVCVAARPGHAYSYTHNWPYDPVAGNVATAPVMLWSVLGGMGLIVALGLVLYAYGRVDPNAIRAGKNSPPVATLGRVDGFSPTPTQRASYKFFAVSAVLFLLQVLCGVLTVHDFVGFTTFFGVDLAKWLPITIVRSWHLQLSLFWIASCWIGATVFLLPMISRPEPAGQLRWVNALFGLLVTLVAGSFVGMYLGPKGILGSWWRALGNQGWEFVELGRVWQWALYAAFGLWAVIVYRGVRPALRYVDPWAMPNWLLYTIVSILLLLTSGFVAGPRTNFVIADFWRWCVIHMWVEAFFEVFTTIIVGYFMYMMGLVSAAVAVRVVYLASILFLGSGLLGISHNFYWNAKSVETVALGSVFSTLQVVPLILLTLEAWRFRRMPENALKVAAGTERGATAGRREVFGLGEAFLFMIGVNFWNFLGAGVFGFIINLPIVNYYEHGTYLTVNHGHAALMGVYGNLAIATMLFCGRYLIRPAAWSEGLLRCSFWALNIGLMLMVVLDLFPAGIAQLMTVMEQGMWAGRSQTFVGGNAFQTMTWLRVIGGSMFLLGGVCPLAWFMASRWRSLRTARAASAATAVVATAEVLAAVDHPGEPLADVPGRASPRGTDDDDVAVAHAGAGGNGHG
jgi:nitric oxide reductase subunit B